MLRGILIGLDGSPYSDAAVDLATSWSEIFDCLLVGVGVIDEPTIRGPEPATAVSGQYRTAYNQLMHSARRMVESRLEKFAISASEAQVSHKLLEDVGLPCDEILREAERYDLIMLGQQTYFHCATQSGSGNTIDRILRNPTRPVVAVPQSLPAKGGDILIAYDGSHEAARTLAAFVPTGLHQLGAVKILSIDTESKVKAAKTADRAVEYLSLHNIKAEPCPTVSLLPPGRIVMDTAKQGDVQLIVMGAKGKSRIWEIFFGSVTQRALNESPVPLFMYH